MPITRRTLLLTAAALPVGASALVDAAPAFAASAAGDVVGKITVGYQGWFACIGDGAPIDVQPAPDKAPASVIMYTFYTEGGQPDLPLISTFSLLYSLPVVAMYLFVSRRYGFRFHGGIKR